MSDKFRSCQEALINLPIEQLGEAEQLLLLSQFESKLRVKKTQNNSIQQIFGGYQVVGDGFNVIFGNPNSIDNLVEALADKLGVDGTQELINAVLAFLDNSFPSHYQSHGNKVTSSNNTISHCYVVIEKLPLNELSNNEQTFLHSIFENRLRNVRKVPPIQQVFGSYQVIGNGFNVVFSDPESIYKLVDILADKLGVDGIQELINSLISFLERSNLTN